MYCKYDTTWMSHKSVLQLLAGRDHVAIECSWQLLGREGETKTYCSHCVLKRTTCSAIIFYYRTSNSKSLACQQVRTGGVFITVHILGLSRSPKFDIRYIRTDHFLFILNSSVSGSWKIKRKLHFEGKKKSKIYKTDLMFNYA